MDNNPLINFNNGRVISKIIGKTGTESGEAELVVFTGTASDAKMVTVPMSAISQLSAKKVTTKENTSAKTGTGLLIVIGKDGKKLVEIDVCSSGNAVAIVRNYIHWKLRVSEGEDLFKRDTVHRRRGTKKDDDEDDEDEEAVPRKLVKPVVKPRGKKKTPVTKEAPPLLKRNKKPLVEESDNEEESGSEAESDLDISDDEE